MKRDTYRSLIIIATIVLAIWSLYPTYTFYTNPPQEGTDEYVAMKGKAINLGLDLQGGIHLVLEVDPTGLPEDQRRDVVARVKEIITNRVDQFGVTEPIIQTEGEWRIVVELPGVQDVERAKNLINTQARLEFKILKPGSDREAILDRIEEHLIASSGDTSSTEETELFEEKPVEDKPSIKRYILSYGEDLMVPADNLATVRSILSSPEVQ